MVLYPEVQKLAQAEIDAVMGQDRFITFEDRDKLLYIRVLALELLRWAPVSPQGLPHHAMREDVYEGYRIPKGTAIIANLVSMSRDKEMYPDLMVFRPERFLDPLQVALWGRIMPKPRCTSNISCILVAFTIAKPLDERGEEFTPPLEYENVGVFWFIPRNQDLLATLLQ
ncbi:cytochrome P450 [Suillus weaverae]|nr:cytochrome P450 [Suillus weaverae]